jgi:hypothetical protein
MNASRILAVSALALLASFGAQADEADGSQYGVQFTGSRTRAEVKAEAVDVARNHSQEPAGSRVLAAVKSTTSRAAVRAQVTQAVRLGQIPSGEAGSM